MSNSKKYFRKSRNDLFEFIYQQKMILFPLEIILVYESKFERNLLTKIKNNYYIDSSDLESNYYYY